MLPGNQTVYIWSTDSPVTLSIISLLAFSPYSFQHLPFHLHNFQISLLILKAEVSSKEHQSTPNTTYSFKPVSA